MTKRHKLLYGKLKELFMKVYLVTKQWCNYDGWPISDPSNKGTFDTEEKAKQFIFKETGMKTALDYGYAIVESNGSTHRWYISPLTVE